MTDHETESILDRISKLMAKAKGTNNENEAAIFAAKAAELLAKHNLDEEMLRQRDADREQGPIGYHPFTQRVPDAWRERILLGVAKVYFCNIVWSRKGRSYTRSGKLSKGKIDPHSYRFVGREHNAKVAQLMAEYLFATVKRMAREYSPYRAEQSNYRKGAGDRLYERLCELAESMRDNTTVQGGGGTALMVLNEDALIDDFLSDIPGAGMRDHSHGAGSEAGYAEADKISLNTQVKERRASRMIAN